MARRGGQTGDGRLSFIVAMAVLGVFIFLAVKFIPVRIAAYEFRDFVRQECRFAAVRYDDAAVASRILDKARELQIPLQKKNLRVERTRKEMIVTASYEQPIDLKVTTYQYRFRVKEQAPLF